MRQWQYYIIDPSGNSYQVENGIVVAIGNYKPLGQTPIGWQDLSLVWERSAEKYGLTRTFSLPLGFVIEGQSILTYLNWKNNFEQQIYLLINRRTLYIDTNEYYFWYKFFYKGELDFSTYNYDDENAKAAINIMEGGLSKLLNADWDTVYEIPCDQLPILFDGINLHKSVKYTVPDGVALDNYTSHYIIVPTVTLSTDGSAAGIALFDQQYAANFDPAPGQYFATTTNYLVILDDTFFQPVTVNIKGVVKMRCLQNDGNEGFEMIFLNQNNQYYADSLSDVIPANITVTPNVDHWIAGQEYDFTFDFNVTLNPGDRIFLYMQTPFIPDQNTIVIKAEFIEGTEFFVNFATQQQATVPFGVDLITLYKRIGAKISGSEDDWTSDYLQTRPDILVSCGDAIRGIEDAVIKTSMKQFFNSVNVIMNCGIGIENNQVVLEEKAHFFQIDNPIYLGQVKQYKDKWATDYIYNTLKIGYPDVNLENVNGRFAFNTSYLYSSPVKRVTKQLLLLSDYGADPFEIEITRITGVSSTDSIRDNKNFFIQVGTLNEDEQYPLLRQGWTITGVPDPDTIFNVGLSVRRLIDVHANWLAGCFTGFDSEELKFETTQYNRGLVANGVDEDGSIPISSLGAPLFKPVNFDFQSPFIPAEDQAMNSIPLEDWVITGGNASDSSDPYDGATSIKSGTTVAPVVAFTTDQAIPFGILNELSFFFKLSAIVPPPTLLRVRFYKGATLARTGNASYNKNNIATYQQILINAAALTVVDSTITDFDRVSIQLSTFIPQFILLDVVKLSIESQIDLTNIMDINPNRCFSFIHPNGKILKGHSIKVGAAPNTEQEQGFLLLATGDTDLNDLVI